MRVLYFRHNLSVVDNDIIDCLRSKRVPTEVVDVIIGKDKESRPIYLDELIHRIHIFRPDVVMCTDDYALDEEGIFARVFAYYHIPYVSWYIDQPLKAHGQNNKKFLKDASIIFVVDAEYIRDLNGHGFKYVYWLPLGANPKAKKPPILNPTLPYEKNSDKRMEGIIKGQEGVEEDHLYRYRIEDIFNRVRSSELVFDIPEDDITMKKIRPFLPNLPISVDVKDRFGAILLTRQGDLVCEDIAWGMRKAGIACSLFNTATKREGAQEVITFDMETLQTMLKDLRPDFVISNNGLGVDGSDVIQKMLFNKGIPFVTWYTDEPNLIEPEGMLPYYKENTIIFSFDKAYEPFLKKRNISYVGWLPLAVNTDRFYPIEEDNIEPMADIIFVGSTGKKQIDAVISRLNDMGLDTDKIAHFIERLIPTYIANWKMIVKDVFKRYWQGDNIPDHAMRLVYGWIEHRAGQALRLNLLSRLRGTNLKVIGEEAWAEFFEEGLYAGEILYKGNNLSGIYSNTPIILNISRPQLKTAVNQRVYDVPACGGFLLTDIRDELYYIFDRDEIATYDYNSDLASVIKYYLSRPGLRHNMAKKARQKVIDGHTYVHRAKTILDVVMARARKSRRSA
ncbi:MAG: glycosyltransferase [Deltaproteobacteria bacterium]|nr:glycosyltransferase [Deltaproteobacteria bacterium]